MFGKTHRLFSLAFALAMGCASPAFAGFYLEYEANIPNPMTKETTKKTIRSWQEGRKLKKYNLVRNEMVIIDLDKGKVFGIDDANKTYWELPATSYGKFASAQLVTMGVQFQPDGSIKVPDDLFKPTGKVRTIDGHEAYEVKVLVDLPIPKGVNLPGPPPKIEASYWLSEEVDVPIEKFVDELRIMLNNPKGPEYKKLFDQWRDLRGYPVETVTTVDTPKGQVQTRETLTVVRREDIPASTFEVPKGYRKTADPIEQAQGMQKMMMQKIEEMKAKQAAGGGAPGTDPGAPRVKPAEPVAPPSGGKK